MAKKRKIVKRPLTPSPVVASPLDNQHSALSIIALVVAILALLGGVFAVYGSVVNGGNVRLHTSADEMSVFLFLRDIFGKGGYDMLGWQTGVSPLLFPDYFLLLAGYAVGLHDMTLFWFYSVSLVIIATIGWVMVADKVLGRSVLVWAFAVLTMALHLVVMSFATADVLRVGFFAVGHHGGLWAVLPYLLWLLLAISASAKPSMWQTAVLAVVLGLSLFSDIIVMVWFVGPAVGVLLIAYFIAPLRVRAWKYLLGALVVGYLIRRAMVAIWPFALSPNTQKFTSLNIEQAFTTLFQLFATGGDFAEQHPFVFFAWLGFFVLLVASLVVFMRTVRRPKRSRQDIDNLTFVIIFFALSAAAAPAAAVATGSNIFAAETEIAIKTRYLHPTMFLPLFSGWVCLLAFVWRIFPFWRVLTERQIQWGGIALSALLLALAVPKVAGLAGDLSRLRLFDAPFFTCLQETAQRRKLRAGVASFLFDHPIAAASVAKGMGITHMARIGNLRRLGIDGNLYVSRDTTNRNYEQGEFDFAVASAHQGTVYISPWRDNNFCADAGRLSCIEPVSYGFIIDGEAIVGEFGQPTEIVDCGPAALYLYDEPFNLRGIVRG